MPPATLHLPPVWTLGFIVLSGLFARVNASPLIPLGQNLIIGLVLVALGGGVMVWTVVTLRSQRTTFIPHRPATALVTTGPFRFSRHPIYLADLVLLLAAGFLMGTSWPLFFLPLLALILRQGFMIPEEKMLRDQFPSEFKSWSTEVRRWL